ncbi:MAG TPA: SCO family protein [Caldilineaceae bacterium]|nr:SCO family protein [Caldilineaceae bacterium]
MTNLESQPLDSVEAPVEERAPAERATTPPASAATAARRRGTGPLFWLAGASALGLLLLMLAGWWFRPPELHGVLIQSPREAQDFTLMTSTGEPMSLSDFRGRYVLLYFGYTYCPDVCPTTLNDLANMVKALGDKRAENVQVILVSVDPERDTPEHLAAYLPAFHADFLGMTGTVEQIQAVASQFGIYFEHHEADEQGNYMVDHTSAVTVIDPDGQVRMVFPYGVTGADMAADLTYLMRRG